MLKPVLYIMGSIWEIDEGDTRSTYKNRLSGFTCILAAELSETCDCTDTKDKSLGTVPNIFGLSTDDVGRLEFGFSSLSDFCSFSGDGSPCSLG